MPAAQRPPPARVGGLQALRMPHQARRLNRHRFLQAKVDWKAFLEIYKIILSISNLKILMEHCEFLQALCILFEKRIFVWKNQIYSYDREVECK
jgi:hypothetical protein